MKLDKDINLYVPDKNVGKRLIDADAFFNDFPELKNYEHASQEYEVDAEPVKHGHWVVERDEMVMHCASCVWVFEYYGGLEEAYNFCPHCGAKMDEVKDETD